jgi:hypothetical protein
LPATKLRGHPTNFPEHPTNFPGHPTNFLRRPTNFLGGAGSFVGPACSLRGRARSFLAAGGNFVAGLVKLREDSKSKLPRPEGSAYRQPGTVWTRKNCVLVPEQDGGAQKQSYSHIPAYWV